MASFFSSYPIQIIFLLLILLLHCDGCNSGRKGDNPSGGGDSQHVQIRDVDYLGLALNVEYLETELFLCGAFGYGLDEYDPELAMGGPSPKGCTMVKDWLPYLNPVYQDIIEQFAFQEVGHLVAIKDQIKESGFPRPELNITVALFAELMDKAFFPKKLIPPFDPYLNAINYILAAYFIPYNGLTAYVGSESKIQNSTIKQLVAGLLAVESGQDAVIRTLLYQIKDMRVYPYPYTVAQFTAQISALRNKLANNGSKDEGIVVKKEQGAQGMVTGNVLVGDENSVAFSRSADELLRILYLTGDNKKIGGFLPNGAKGKLAKTYHDY